MTKEESLIKMGKRIREYRERLALSQQELADKAGYTSRAMICKIENGKVDLSRSKLIDISLALQVDVSDIMDVTIDCDTYFMTEDEKEFIEMYRKASQASRLKAYAELIKGCM